MSFATDIKDEIARVQVGDMQEMVSELAGFMPMCGRIHFLGNQKYCLSFTTENAATSRRIFSFLKALYHDHITVEVRKSQQLKKRNVYHILLKDYDLSRVFLDDIKFLKNENVFMPNYKIDPYLVRRDSLKRAFLRGAFLGSGTLSNPSKTYHMEFITSQSLFAQSIRSLLSTVNLKANIAKRKEEYIVYLKEAEMISDLLSLMGSNQGVLAFEDVRVMKDMRNQVNRLVNCETANLSKTINAALGQIQDIKFIEERIGLDKLPDSLEEIAEIRLSNPSSSLKELGEKMHPPVGKSGVSHRLKKIQSIANKLRGENK
ncbi:sporulation regulator WhiA [Tissierellia bacterium S5-A11]|nr:sporulation regulator WhiA [Tissierellia bacterium S5-A11]